MTFDRSSPPSFWTQFILPLDAAGAAVRRVWRIILTEAIWISDRQATSRTTWRQRALLRMVASHIHLGAAHEGGPASGSRQAGSRDDRGRDARRDTRARRARQRPRLRRRASPSSISCERRSASHCTVTNRRRRGSTWGRREAVGLRNDDDVGRDRPRRSPSARSSRTRF